MFNKIIAINTALFSALFGLSFAIAAPAQNSHEAVESDDAHHEASPYDATRDAKADVAAALQRAKQRNVNTVIIMGANWCHDSRGLAGHLSSVRFQPLIAAKYEVVYVDINVPQNGEGRNLDIAARYGVTDIDGTPNVLVISPEGKLVNTADDARSWRDAASRDVDDIYAYFAEL
jgi:thiol-disulfide isomerase/thioredoxin